MPIEKLLLKKKKKLFIINQKSRSREGILSFYSSDETLPGELHLALGSPAQKGHGPVEASPEESHEDD